MKVLLITSVFPKMVDGVADHAYGLAAQLAALGDDVHVLTSDDDRVIREDGLFKIYPVMTGWVLREFRRVSDTIARIRPDIIHVQYDSVPGRTKKLLVTFLPLLVRIRFGNVRVVSTIHEFREHRLRWKLRALVMAVFSHKAVFADPSDMAMLRKQFFFVPGKKLVHIPIAANIIPDADAARIPKPELRKRLGIPQNDVLIFYFGIIGPLKGIDALIDCFEEAATEEPRARLLLISGMFSDKAVRTDYQAGLAGRIAESRCKDRIMTLGPQESDAMSRYILASDIAVYPYRLGVTYQRGALLAVLAHGVPVITTYDDRRCPAMMSNGVHAVLVRVGDTASLRQKLAWLIKDAAARQEIGSGGKAYYEKNFSNVKTAQLTHELYQEVAS